MAIPVHFGPAELHQSAHMMNSSVSISDLSSTPSEVSDKSSLGLQKTAGDDVKVTPFHELMRDMAAQQVSFPGQILVDKLATIAADPTGVQGERQESAVTEQMALPDPMPGPSQQDGLLATAVQLMGSHLLATESKPQGKSSPFGQASALDSVSEQAVLPTLQMGSQALPSAILNTPPTLFPAGSPPDLTSAQWGEWKETRLSQSLTLITQPMAGLNEANLNDFAMQQGLDAKTVRWLLGEPSPAAKGLLATGQPHPWGVTDGPTADAWLDLTPLSAHSFLGLVKGTVSGPLDTPTARVDGIVGAEAGSALAAGTEAGDAGQSGSAHAGVNGQSASPSIRNAAEPPGAKAPALPFNTPLLGQDLADKMSTAIGKRLLESIEKGDWQLKLHLKPVELGHIEVDLKMRDNGLEAKFTASQSIARELLESGLGRLKETLQQAGMDVASVRVNDGPSSRNGGDPTPRQPQQGQNGSPPKENVSRESEAPVATGNSSISDGRLDLMV